jgi:hypothetical protein
VHTRIYGELAIHANGLISLPFEVMKQAIDNALSLFWRQILRVMSHWSVFSEGSTKKGGPEQRFQSGHDATKNAQKNKTRSGSPTPFCSQ